MRLTAAKRRIAKIDGIIARRNSHILQIFDQIGMGADAREDAFAQRWDQSNWRMDQCAIHMDGARRMLHQLWQTFCPILPQLNVIQCTDRRMAAT